MNFGANFNIIMFLYLMFSSFQSMTDYNLGKLITVNKNKEDNSNFS